MWTPLKHNPQKSYCSILTETAHTAQHQKFLTDSVKGGGQTAPTEVTHEPVLLLSLWQSEALVIKKKVQILELGRITVDPIITNCYMKHTID